MSTKAQKKKEPPLYTLTAGAIAGAVEATVTYPTEFVKTQLQLQEGNKALRPGGTVFKGPVDVLVKTVQTQGITAVYRGLSALVIGTAAKAGVRFFAFDQFKDLLKDQDGKTTGVRNMLGVKSIIQAEGFGGIYRGVIPVMARQGANSAVRFGVYSSLNDVLKQRMEPGKAVPAAYTFGIGAIAGVITVYTTMPLDVIKTKMQGLRAKELYSGVFDCTWKVLKKEGVLAFWKGATPRLARLTMSGGIVFTVYEQVMQAIHAAEDIASKNNDTV
ncbi:hypothetical protein DFQ26_000806 [Actinomortierella ambigua]|nr:hypothetical protein DFQ26_000806 [Actinomortierella ambigua]